MYTTLHVLYTTTLHTHTHTTLHTHHTTHTHTVLHVHYTTCIVHYNTTHTLHYTHNTTHTILHTHTFNFNGPRCIPDSSQLAYLWGHAYVMFHQEYQSMTWSILSDWPFYLVLREKNHPYEVGSLVTSYRISPTILV